MRAPLVAAIVAMLLIAVPVSADRSPTAEERSGQGGDGDEPLESTDRGRSNGDDDRGKDDEHRPPTPIPIGEFAVDESTGTAEGEFVTFTYNHSGVQGFTANGTRLFDLIALDGSLPDAGEVRVDGSRLKLEGEGFKVVVHDNPTAVSRIETDEPIRIEFAEGTTLASDGHHYVFTINNTTGKIKGDNITINGTTLVAAGDILVLVDNSRGSIDDHRPDINEAIGKGHVGAEASFNKRENDTEAEVVSYGNVTMTTVKAERGNLTVLIEGHGFDGRVLVLNVDGRVIGASQSDHLNILFDNASMTRASGLADALDPDDDGIAAEYYVVFDPELEAFQLIVSVPHYSVHTLSVGLIEVLPPPSVIFGVVFGVALLVPSAWALFRKK